ncbi:MAG: polyamine aminopropyltransferase [Armatimonadetes bacterium]|nr:polyamine aminopropyltransferase [Armatimonadota bacterium]
MQKARSGQWYMETVSENEYHLHAIEKVLFVGESKFQQVSVLETPHFGKMLILDGDAQHFEKDEHIYHESLVHPALILPPDPRKVLILGGGEGATLREALRHKTLESAVMIDIDREVVELCAKHLPHCAAGAFSDPRAVVRYEDARKFLENSPEKYDVIISDLTEPFTDSPSHFLFTREFFSIVSDRLANPGILALQASRMYSDGNLHGVIHQTLKGVFSFVRSYQAFVPSFFTAWGFITASNTLDPLSFSAPEIDKRISLRLSRPCRYYDGTTHTGMFSLSRDLREMIASQTTVLEDLKPFSWEAGNLLVETK